jgi:antitoxin HicB
MTKKTLDYYMSLPYGIILNPSPEGGYAIAISDLPGCISQGETVEEALVMIEDAKRGWIEIALEDGIEIPEPAKSSLDDFSGRFNVRVPKSLHKALSEQAKKENISLNQLIIYHLSRGIGY